MIESINFLFGGDPPFSKDATGYDTVSMRMESDDGGYVRMERKIVDGKKGEAGAGTVNVVSSFEDIKDGDLSISKMEYSDLLLRCFGIKEHHKIVSTQEWKTQAFTIRAIFHLFEEDTI